MQTSENKTASTGQKPAAGTSEAWYDGPYKDALLYLLIAVFFVELVVGGVAFFYGVMHAAPETPGGAPMARFPWFGWAAAAILAPVGLMLIVHLAGTWVARFLGRAQDGGTGGGESDAEVPERLRRFYAIIRNAPTVVLLLGILLLGAGLFFVDGAFSALVKLGRALTPYIPWIASSLAAIFVACYLVYRWFVFRQQRMQQEYAYRHEVLRRTGIVLVDKNCVPLPPGGNMPGDMPQALGSAVVIESTALPAGSTAPKGSGTAEDTTPGTPPDVSVPDVPTTAPATEAPTTDTATTDAATPNAPASDAPGRQ